MQWSQRTLADKMGYNHSTITRIETGKIDIPQSRIAQFSKVLGVSIAYLMGWDETETQSTESDLSIQKREFLKRIETMSDDQLARLEKILDLVEQTEI